MVAPNKPGKNKLASQPAVDKSRLQAADETSKDLDELDTELAELKAKHDQYFLGLERFEPVKDRENLKKRLNALRTSHIRNTGVKFRAQALWQKYLSYERMWLRIAREIEDGTYSRDLFKARMRKEKREQRVEKKQNEATELDENELSAEGSGDLASALAEASAAVDKAKEAKAAPADDVKAREPKTDPELQAYVPPDARPKSEPAKPPPPPAAAAKPSGSFDGLVRPATSPPPPPAEARKSGTFDASKVPPPPPPAAAAKPSGSFPTMKGPPPPPPQPASTRPSGSFPAMKGPPPPPSDGKPVSNPAAAKPVAPGTSGSVARPPPPPGASGSRPPPPPGAARPANASGALPDDKMKAIYNAYVAAKKQCKESTDGITYESVSKTINSQMPELMKQHNAKAVDFKVVIKNGKATLKAVPRT